MPILYSIPRPADAPVADPHADYNLTASLDRSLRVAAANQEMIQQFSGPGDEICGTAMCDLLAPSLRTKVRSRLQRLLEGQQTRFDERSVDLLSVTGTVKADMAGTSITRGRGQVDGVVVLVRLHGTPAAPAPYRTSARLLSDMDARILEGVASGASTVQMAASLFLSRGGVEYHLTALLRRMKAKNRTALISKAYAMGYFDLGSWPPRVVAECVNQVLPAG